MSRMPILCQLLLFSVLPLLTLKSPDGIFSTGVSGSSFRQNSKLSLTLNPDLEREDDSPSSSFLSSSNVNQRQYREEEEEPLLLESLYQSLNPSDELLPSHVSKHHEPNFRSFLTPEDDFDSREVEIQEEKNTNKELEVDKQILRALEDILGTLKNKDHVSSHRRAPSYREEKEEEIDLIPGTRQESENDFWNKFHLNYPDLGVSLEGKPVPPKSSFDVISNGIRAESKDENRDLFSLKTEDDDQKKVNPEEDPILLENLYKSGKLDIDQPDLLMKYLWTNNNDEKEEKKNLLSKDPSVSSSVSGYDTPSSHVVSNDNHHLKLNEHQDDKSKDDLRFLFPDDDGQEDVVIDSTFDSLPRKRKQQLQSIRKIPTQEKQQDDLEQLLQQMISNDEENGITFTNKVSSSYSRRDDETKTRDFNRVKPYFSWQDDLETSQPILPSEWKQQLHDSGVMQQSYLQGYPSAFSGRKLPASETDGVTSSKSNEEESLKKRTDVKKPGPRFPPELDEVDAERMTPRDQTIVMTSMVLLLLTVGVVLVASLILVVRRHEHIRRKLSHLLGQLDISETVHAYQDLCRQRMQTKSNEQTEILNPDPENAAVTASTGSGARPKTTSGSHPFPGSSSSAVRSSSSKKKQQSHSLSSDSGGSTVGASSRSSTSSWSEEPVSSTMDISTGHMILSYMEDHLKNKDRLNREWEGLCSYEADPSSTSVGNLASNRKKNRYPDILPFDHSRVILNDLFNSSKSDYINASTITDHDPRNPAFIATQGPLPNTTGDFWQMVWEQGSQTIVMLTRLMKSGSSLCHRYWPEEGSMVYASFEVHLVSEHIWCEDYLVRSLLLKNRSTGETRTITQFHFLSWPENSVPSSAKAILDFRRKVNKSFKGKSCPIVVHCSDGCGRTGTYCLIDMVLNRMSKGVKEIDIAATIEHMRDQRMAMVRTKEQFEYVLKAVAEEVHAILRSLQGTNNP